MNQNSEFLSSSILKDKAKGALSGNYGKMILAALVIGAISFAIRFALNFTEIILFDIFYIFKGLLADGLTQEQLLVLVDENAFEQIHRLSFTVMTYITRQAANILISVFNIGLNLCCLNIACGRTMKISDVFHGFLNQFGKSLKLTAILVLYSQILYLPNEIFSYLLNIDAGVQFLLPALLLYVAGTLIYIIISLNLSQTFLLFLDFPRYSITELLKLSAHIMKGHKARLFYIELSFLPLMFLSLCTFFIGNLWLTPYMNLTYTFFFLNLMQAREKSC